MFDFFTIIKLKTNILDIGGIKLTNTKLTDLLIGNSLMFASGRLNKAISTYVADLNLNLEQAFIMHELLLTNECAPINQKKLSDTLRLQYDNVSRNLTRLESKGLIIRKKNDGSKREKVVQLSSKGQRVAEKVNEVIFTQRALAFAHIENEDRAKLIETLQAIMKG